MPKNRRSRPSLLHRKLMQIQTPAWQLLADEPLGTATSQEADPRLYARKNTPRRPTFPPVRHRARESGRGAASPPDAGRGLKLFDLNA